MGVSAKLHSVTIAQLHAPNFTHEDNKVEECYQVLDKILKAVPKRKSLLCSATGNPRSNRKWEGNGGPYPDADIVTLSPTEGLDEREEKQPESRF